jgi:hypothetical protein
MGFKFSNVGNDIDCGIREVSWKGSLLAMGDVKMEMTPLYMVLRDMKTTSF